MVKSYRQTFSFSFRPCLPESALDLMFASKPFLILALFTVGRSRNDSSEPVHLDSQLNNPPFTHLCPCTFCYLQQGETRQHLVYSWREASQAGSSISLDTFPTFQIVSGNNIVKLSATKNHSIPLFSNSFCLYVYPYWQPPQSLDCY